MNRTNQYRTAEQVFAENIGMFFCTFSSKKNILVSIDNCVLKAVWSDSAQCSFTGKEKDSETGYYYFGARYYNSDLSLWLSVDPMADKYPSLSPYNYCAWNPMKIIDPNGDSVFITGDDASKKEALRQIQQKSSNLTFSIDGNNMLTCKGNAKTKMEKYMKKIIESKNTNVDLCVQNNSSYRDQTIDFGGFDGNTLSNDGTMVFASQVVNVLETNKWDKKCMNPGNGIWHEIAEAYEGGLISLNAQVDAQPALVGVRNPIYDKAHYNAGAFFPGTIVSNECSSLPPMNFGYIEQMKWNAKTKTTSYHYVR